MTGVARVVAALRERSGVAPTRVLGELGIGRRAIAAALAEGAALAPRRGWLALRDADPALIAAARAGVVLTCVTQASRLGLWVLDASTPHVVAAPTASRVVMPGARVHWCAPVVPRAAGALEDSILNCLVIAASCLPYEAALTVWESALRSGRTTREELVRLPLRPAARRLASDASPFADSGLESLIPPRLRWLGVPIRPQIWIRGHRVDFLIGDRLVLQIDGGHHVGLQRAEDVAHDAALMLMGFHVIRVTYVQVIERWHEVQDLVMRAVAQGLHRAA